MNQQQFSFNLVEEPWLPCIDATSRRPLILGLREALSRAHELQELADASPLVTAALHRLLLAMLHRILGPPSVESWLELWRARRWDTGQIGSYFDQWRHRFDLFHPQRPFYQTTSVAEEYGTTPATTLLLDLASGNNATLFDHTLDEQYRPMDPGKAARAIVMFQAFAPGGLVNFEKGQAEHRSANAAPLARGALVLVRGKTLFETLQLNLVRYDPGLHEPPGTTAKDRPAWESDSDVVAESRAPLGHVDYLTWQSRRLRLIPELDANGRTVVRRVVLMKGAQFPDGYRGADYEQMLAYRKREKAAPNQDPFIPIGFMEERVFWRDSQALLNTFNPPKDLPPRTLRWLSEVASNFPGELAHNGESPPALDLLGLTGDRAKLLFWRHERLPLPTAYLRDHYLVEALGTALKWAEDGDLALRRAVNRLSVLALVPDAGQGGRQPDRALVDGLAAHLDVGRASWSALEVPFKRLLRDLPDRNVDAASQVAHAISTHQVSMKFDFYTAVDDLRPEDTEGADMLGMVEFNSACFYRYANVDLAQLAKNLDGDDALARQTLEAFIRASVAAIPTGKQHSMAAHNPPALVFGVARERGLWSVANAFLQPVRPVREQHGDLVGQSTKVLDHYWGQLVGMYGQKGIAGTWLAVLDGDQQLEHLASLHQIYSSAILLSNGTSAGH